MSVIIATRSSRAAVVGSDSQYVSSTGVSQAPYDKTFQANFLIGVHVGLLEFAGLDVKAHISNALGNKHFSSQNAVRAIAAHISPILKLVGDDEVAFRYRKLDIIVASRAKIASVRLSPNMETLEIAAEYNEDNFSLAAGSEQAKNAALAALSRFRSMESYGITMLRDVAERVIESAIDAGGSHPYHPDVPSCCGPVCLRHLQ